ncbi:probable tyrosine-protein phosphatase DG1060 isoform X2 [Selaginella moellendorffii]|uniref:probable tyrosine-protein phosphatase DG1060 isoform X2 n=1 Tax=Selaginella moellendorffii TaxID=88036 RepID=UPI000D1CB00C|nr:probable tyrosine-protein phosphatase DG1060 isoform X2 [Selaginella moellendorffii]|eukprot:XP_024520740.1 probable tyrosine-protein phosphatase DG1060 isoform X2 [Selaginella moellendorffii]
MSSYFVPPLNYGMVEYDLTRSGVVHQLNFPFLERLNLRTVLYLSQDEPSQQFLSFLDEQGIHFRRTHQSSSTTAAETTGSLSEAQVILRPENYPLHVMCKQGRNTTGTVIGCLRKLQRWNLTSIFEEHRRYTTSKVRILNEQFIEMFDANSVTIPPNHPDWL